MEFAHNAGLCVLLGVSLTFGTAARAEQEPIGEIVATIDGEAFEWRTLGPDGSGTDYNTSLTDQYGFLDVSVMGFPPGGITMEGVLQLTFMLMPGSDELMDQEVLFAPEGMNRMWMPLEGEDLIAIEQLDATAPVGHVSGQISGRICQKESLVAEPDPERCKDIEGTFTSQLPHVEM